MLYVLQGLLAVPFVLHSQPTAVFEPRRETTEQMAANAQRRYAEIMRDVEELIADHSQYTQGVTLQFLDSQALTSNSFPPKCR